MNTQYKLFGLLLSAALPVAANAQDSAAESKTDTTVSREIEIVKEYNPTIKEATKITTSPELKTDVTKKNDVSYSVWSTPIVPGNDSVPPLDFALVGKSEKEFKREGYLKLGAGNYKSFLGETYVPVLQKKKDLLEFYGSHNSSFGKVRLTNDLYSDLETDNFRTKAKINENFAKAVYTHNIRAKELSAYADFGYTGFNYYGLDSYNLEKGCETDTVYGRNQSFTNFDAGVRYRTKKFIDRWSYDGQTNYQLFHTHDGLSEHNIYTNLNGRRLIDNGYVSLNFDMYNIFTSLPADSVPFRYKDAQNTDNYTVLMFTPAYIIKSRRAELNIGVKAAFGIGSGRSTSITPDLLGNISIVPDYWFLYAGITGDYTVNNYRNMAKTNRYIALDNRAEDTYTPIDVYIGSKVNLFKYALLDVNVGYKVISNPYFFVADNCDTTKHNANGSFYNLDYGKDEGLFSAGLGITTNYKERVMFGVKGKVNKWALSKGEEAWMMPTTELQANLSVLPVPDLRVWLAYNHLGGRKALFGPYGNVRNMKNVNDLSLGATYKAMSWLNVFLNLNNVLSNEYEQWYGYANQHFNLMAGLVVNF